MIRGNSTLAALVGLALLCLPTHAGATPQGRKFGLGIGLGSPSSLTIKYFLEETLALDVALDVQRFGAAAGLHGDLLWHFAPLATNADLKLLPYLGVGLELGFWQSRVYSNRWGWVYSDNGFNLGARVPLGLAFWPVRAPLEFFIEVGPELWLLPAALGLFGTVGVRYYF